jgi:2-dehydropantoate 2-reductase
VSRDTIIIPLLNGVDIDERVRKNLKQGIVLPTCLYVSSLIERPGTVTQKGKSGVILCGKDPDNPGFDPGPLIGFFDRMNIDFQWVDNPYPAIWEKYVFIAAFGLVTACLDKTLGEALSEKEAGKMAEEIMKEIVLLAQRRGVELPENVVASSFEKAKNFPFETTTSFQRDIRSKKESNEKDIFGGTIIRLGREYGIPTPATCSAWAKIEERLRS